MKQFLRKFKLLVQGKLPDYDEYITVVQLLNEERKNNVFTPGEEKLTIPVAGFDDLSYEPTDSKERVIYAARVDEFYEDILKDKVRSGVAEIRDSLAKVGIDRDLPSNMTRDQYDFFLRGMEAGLWKIHDWATVLQGELKDKQ